MNSRKIIIPGGSGFIGDSLSRHFAALGYEVIVLSRAKVGLFNNVRYVLWDGRSIGEWARYIDGAYAVINLTGRSVNCRFTKKNRKEIVESRVHSVNVLLQACSQSAIPPLVFIQASSVGFYGNTSASCTEESPAGVDYLARVCTMWEDAFFRHSLPSTRRVVLRFGVVLGKGGGALSRMLPWVRCFLGGHHGGGKQQVSWIHLKDLIRMMDFTLSDSSVEGIYNATSEHPVSNALFMAFLRHTLGKPWSPPIPAFMVRLVSYLFMRTDASVLLHGVPCFPKRFKNQGFEFKYPRLPEALHQVLNATKSM